MKKLLLAAVLSTAALSTTSTALAYPMQGGGCGGCGTAAMGGDMNMQPSCSSSAPFEPTVENITQMAEHRLAMGGNKNLKLDSVTEKDGKFTIRITTLDGELVKERVIDPNNPQSAYMNREPLTLEQARDVIEGRLAMRGNPNIKLGEIKEVDGQFIVTITTKKGSLVEEITIDPKNPYKGHMKNGKGRGNMGMYRNGHKGRGHHGGGW